MNRLEKSKITPRTGNKAVISARQAIADDIIVPVRIYAITAAPGPAIKMALPLDKKSPMPIMVENPIMLTWRSLRVSLETVSGVISNGNIVH